MRHSLAHIMAAAVQLIWPKAKFGVGPVVENGFYYDIDIDHSLHPDDLPKIEAKMRELIKRDLPFERFELDLDEAIKFCKKQGQDYKVELLQDLKKFGTTSARDIGAMELGVEEDSAKVRKVSFYRTGKFEDLCRGPHLKSTGEVGVFALTKISGAYWRGDEHNPQLQRIYGVAFETQRELDQYLTRLEEAEKRDHRKLGQELDLFVSSELVGAGLPLFTPRGTTMINAMMDLVREINAADNYQEVRTGHITRNELYERSGHWEKFKDNYFQIKASSGEDEMALKPMNCPHHTQLYASQLRSYRDLPIKYAEFSTLHRNEVKGALGGLTRVRALTMDDAHAFVRPDQIEAEIQLILKQVERLFGTYQLDYWLRLSLRDPEQPAAYLGGEEIWNRAETKLAEQAKQSGVKFERALGEAAFYGPKMDFMATDAIGREWQVSTIQLDFNQPERFDLSYIDEKGRKQRPVMIHRALNGTLERMLGILIEHYAGDFPVWLAPEQVRLATVSDSDKIADFACKLRSQMEQAGLRIRLDDSNESVGKKIRSAELAKVPYTIVVGEQEVESHKVKPRVRHQKESREIEVSKLIEALTQKIKDRIPDLEL